jgi:TetR/AcrR family tetracycline transcriptional repressor
MSEPVVTKERIVVEAMSLLRSGGLAAVNLRAVAQRMAIKAPSLYWHIESKEALYGLMSRKIFRSCLATVPSCRSWEQWLREFGLAIWRAQERIPDIRQLIMLAPFDLDEREHCLAIIVGALVEHGFDARLAVTAQESVQALVTGWTTLEMTAGLHAEPAETRFIQSLEALINGWGQLHRRTAKRKKTSKRAAGPVMRASKQ